MDGIDKHKFPQVVKQQVSADGARKYVLELEDGALVETVGIPHGDLAVPEG
ncbi:MAG: hypothetical protein Q4G41_04805 [Coriobacteriales bacterium]|nr:hypothetical protein [Coriobacteriales bacterium]